MSPFQWDRWYPALSAPGEQLAQLAGEQGVPGRVPAVAKLELRPHIARHPWPAKSGEAPAEERRHSVPARLAEQGRPRERLG